MVSGPAASGLFILLPKCRSDSLVEARVDMESDGSLRSQSIMAFGLQKDRDANIFKQTQLNSFAHPSLHVLLLFNIA